VNKLVKIKEETWQPELVLDFSDGRKQSFNLSNKWSSTIFQELMDTAGGNSWTRWKTERAEAGLPIVDGPSDDHISTPPRPTTGAAAVLP
jgi:small subunit ribosomal protein S25